MRANKKYLPFNSSIVKSVLKCSLDKGVHYNLNKLTIKTFICSRQLSVYYQKDSMDRAHKHKFLPLKLSSIVGNSVASIKKIHKQYMTIRTTNC